MEIDVFISHHTSSSLHIVEAIVNKLEGVGVRCWYAPRDTKGAYAGSIADAIHSCKVFLLILNKPSSYSFDVLNEINMVSERLRNAEHVIVIPFHTADANEELGDDMKYYIGRMHWIDAMTPPLYDRINELVQKICISLGKKDIVDSKNISTSTLSEYKLITRLPQARDVFDGRDEIIEEINKNFSSGNKCIFIEGIGGIGKTEIAKQYAIRYQKDYNSILFVRYISNLMHLINDDNEFIIDGLTRNDSENNEEYFNRKLNILKTISDEKVLIIIDNFDVEEDKNLKEFLTGNYRVIFTTRNQHPGYQTIKVGPIKDEEKLFSIFEKNYGNSLSFADKEYVRKIFELIEYHTYAIELIAKQMSASFIEPKEMLKIMQEGALKNAVTEDVSGRDSMKSAFSHICSLFNIGNLSNIDKNILMYLSIMGINGVPASKFKEWCELESFNEINSLIRKSWIRKENGQKISIHPLVREVIWSELTPNLTNCKNFLYKFAKYIRFAWGRPLAENIAVLDCAYAVFKYFADEPNKSIYIFDPICALFWELGRFEDSQEGYRKLYDSIVKQYGENSELAGYCAIRYAGSYYNAGQLKESIPWYRKGLELSKQYCKEENLDLALAYEKTARTYIYDENPDYDKAEELFNTAIDIRKRLIERANNGEKIKSIDEHQDFSIERAEISNIMTIMEIGRLYQAKGDYEKAYEYADDFIKQYSNYEKKINSNLAYGYYDAGVCLLNMAQKLDKDSKEKSEMLDKAENLLKEVQKINEETRGGMALDTLQNEETLGDVYAEKKQYADASNCYLAVLNMLEKYFPHKVDYINRIKQRMTFNK